MVAHPLACWGTARLLLQRGDLMIRHRWQAGLGGRVPAALCTAPQYPMPATRPAAQEGTAGAASLSAAAGLHACSCREGSQLTIRTPHSSRLGGRALAAFACPSSTHPSSTHPPPTPTHQAGPSGWQRGASLSAAAGLHACSCREGHFALFDPLGTAVVGTWLPNASMAPIRPSQLCLRFTNFWGSHAPRATCTPPALGAPAHVPSQQTQVGPGNPRGPLCRVYVRRRRRRRRPHPPPTPSPTHTTKPLVIPAATHRPTCAPRAI